MAKRELSIYLVTWVAEDAATGYSRHLDEEITCHAIHHELVTASTGVMAKKVVMELALKRYRYHYVIVRRPKKLGPA